jgi:hypothetical protein
MKKTKILLVAGLLSIAGLVSIAADHIDAPAVQGGSADITDYYAFQGEDTSTIAFVVNTQGLFSPTATSSATFNEDVMIEFNIDTNGDAVEELVIQAIARDGKMYFFGPVAPSATGLNSTVLKDSEITGVVDITSYGSSALTSTNSVGMKFFAGPRDDPFFMDFAQYGEIIAGNATAFNNPGADTFAGSNVMSIVVEVPKSMIGGSGSINTWVEAKNKQ